MPQVQAVADKTDQQNRFQGQYSADMVVLCGKYNKQKCPQNREHQNEI